MYPFFFNLAYPLNVEITLFLDKKVVNRANEGITEHAGSPVKVISKYLTLKQLLPSKMGKISLMQLSNEEINTDEVAHRNDLPKSYFQLSLPQVHV